MSSFMKNCEGCGYLIPTSSTCPNCQHSGEPANPSPSVETKVDTLEEFKRRRQLHNRNSNIVMCLKMLTGFFGLFSSGGAVFLRAGKAAAKSNSRMERFESGVEGTQVNYEAIILTAIIFVIVMVFAAIYIWFERNSERFLPTSLCCPECEEQLEQLESDYENCPGCFARLT